MKIPYSEFKVDSTEHWGNSNVLHGKGRVQRGENFFKVLMELVKVQLTILKKLCVLLCAAVVILQIWAIKCLEYIRTILSFCSWIKSNKVSRCPYWSLGMSGQGRHIIKYYGINWLQNAFTTSQKSFSSFQHNMTGYDYPLQYASTWIHYVQYLNPSMLF